MFQLYKNIQTDILDQIFPELFQFKTRSLFWDTQYKTLKINSSSNRDTLFIEDKALYIENSITYLGDVFNDRRDNTALCKDWSDKAVGTSIELFSILGDLRYPT